MKMEIRKTELHAREMLNVWMDIELLLMSGSFSCQGKVVLD